jgi:asparagine synthase (glutamine-hydrolysing)
MCGIAGVLGLNGRTIASRSELEAMIGSLRHRGPDGFGYYSQGPLGFAHARLSIIDLETGAQPMANEDESVWITFNGEIFNYHELRIELEACGHRFHTRSDTETIVHAYEEYGDAFVERLNGQFALAIWDVKRQRLVLARDRVGIRPLFYLEDAGRLLFASEVKALRPAMQGGLRLDTKGLAQVFTFWSAIGEHTVFERVKSLPPGHLLVVEQGVPTLKCYWRWSSPSRGNESSLSFEAAADELRERMIEAVRLQLRADVPVGAYLSGGLDSSGIVALIRKYSNTPVRTYSVGFEDPEFDESRYQNMMAAHLGTEHSSIRCTSADIGRLFPRLVHHTESPVLRTAPVPLMLLSGLVREMGFKVVLTGEGADEVFGGYDIFKEAKVRRFWAREPGSKARAGLLTRLYPYLKHSPVQNAAMASSFFGQNLGDTSNPFYAHMPRWSAAKRLWGFFSAEIRATLNEGDPVNWATELLPDDFSLRDGLARDQYVEAQTLMSGYLLCSQGDRVAMANSVEGRFPFLDHNVIEFANRLPSRYKLRGLTEKAVLRRALGDLLPTEIAQRTKQPYRAPDNLSFFIRGEPLDYVAELLGPARVRAAGYFDAAAVTRLFEKCRAGRAIGFSDNMAFVGILSTMLLDDQFVRRETM